MALDTSTKGFATAVPWTLPLHVLLPYAWITSGYRGLSWAWETRNLPFFLTLGAMVLSATVSSFLIWRLLPKGIWFYRLGVVIALLHTGYVAMAEKRHSLLILVFFFFAGGVVLAEKLSRVLEQPFYDSRRRWWEAYPKPLPGLRAYLFPREGAEESCAARLSNFGSHGCFVFSEERQIPFSPRFIRIESGDRILLEASVDSVIETGDGFGCGLRFRDEIMDGDWSKDLKDYLGFLRRSGYEVS